MEIFDSNFSKRALELMDVGVWVGRLPAGETLLVNPRFVELLGVPSSPGGELASVRLLSQTGEPLSGDALPLARVLGDKCEHAGDELVAACGDGTGNIVRLTVRRMSEQGADAQIVVATAVDVSAEVAARHDESVARSRLTTAVEHAPVVLWAIDREGVVTLSEGQALEPLGLMPGQLVGQSVFDIYAEHPTVPAYLRRALEGESLSYSVEVGDAFFETWVAPVRDRSGALAGAIGVSTDITRRNRLQAKVIQDDRIVALGTLAASVAHEINNPLTYALLSLGQLEQQLLLARSSEGDEQSASLVEQLQEPIERLRDGLQRIHHVTHGLRSFTRPDDRMTLVDVRSALDSILRVASKEIEANANVTLELSTTPLVRASEASLGQVFFNLIQNSLQAVSGKGAPAEIRIRTRADAEHVWVTISDSGPGVAPELRDRLFEPFVTSKPVGQGTGLGLFVCRNIVRNLGGEISVADREGGGAEFCVKLPIARTDKPATRPPPAGEPRPELELRARVLVVDDDVHVGTVLARQLELVGCSVTYVQEGAKAIELLSSASAFDLCFCDLVMPGVSGMDVYAALRARAPGSEKKIVFMTGGAYTPAAKSFFEAIPEQRVEKPFDIVAEAARRLAR